MPKNISSHYKWLEYKTFEFSLECLSEDSPTKTLRSSSRSKLIKVIRPANSLLKQKSMNFLQKMQHDNIFFTYFLISILYTQDLWLFTACRYAEFNSAILMFYI